MTDINPIKPFIYLSIWDTPLLAVLVLLTVVGVGLLLIYLARRHRRKVGLKVVEYVVPSKPKHDFIDEAQAKLLKTSTLINAGKFQELYLVSTEILKDCVSEILEVGVRDMTTREIKNDKSIPDYYRGVLVKFLCDVDRLKFDDIQTDAERTQEIYKLAEDSLASFSNYLRGVSVETK